MKTDKKKKEKERERKNMHTFQGNMYLRVECRVQKDKKKNF